MIPNVNKKAILKNLFLDLLFNLRTRPVLDVKWS